MQKTKLLLSLCLSVSFLVGCRSNTPTAPLPNPNSATDSESTKVAPDQAKTECEAYSDPAQAENCRFLKSVAEAKKKSHANNVVKHSPGSIKQP